ncbi:MAG: fructose-bisphosphate aldolase [Candidatus Woesebacteria bacterium]|nr:fructose-bisphosphate aldolase [Candidatus Woesebacteria bacterium]
MYTKVAVNKACDLIMEEIIKKLLADGKGILAADESTHTIEKRFAALGLTSTPELNENIEKCCLQRRELKSFCVE